MSSLGRHAEFVRRLHAALLHLDEEARLAGVPPLRGREWFELLERKLIPQLSDEAYLVVAVVGGTNIGKSVVFNHIAGTRASATSPLASGTRHPVCLTPSGFVERHDLSLVFPGFEMIRWDRAEDALEDSAEHRLFWRESSNTPANLLVLDTPDIDSDARINWQRADHIRRCADLLVAVLTQQKYNDAAVKQFFRQAADEDKAVIVIFNQCLLPDDEEYWPKWLETFVRETGVHPEWVYLAPNERGAAENLRLPFYLRTPPGAATTDEATAGARDSHPRSLLEDLSRVRFGAVKLRALQGALRHVTGDTTGVPAYLAEITAAAAEFQAAAQLLSAHQLAEIDSWPLVPNALLIAEIRRWWQEQRTGWPAKVHGFYNVLSQGLTWPVRRAREALRRETVAPWERYRAREWGAVLTAIERVYDKLLFVSQLGNDVLRPRLDRLLDGIPRAELLEHVRTAHDTLDLDDALARTVRRELAEFRQESPGYYEFFRRIDQAAAAMRPMTSVVLFVTGFAPVGHALTPVITDTALQGLVHVAGDVAGGTISAAVGDVVLSESAAAGSGYLEAKFRRLHAAFAAERAAWLADLLNRYLLGSLPEEIRRAAELPTSKTFRETASLVGQLRQLPGCGFPSDST